MDQRNEFSKWISAVEEALADDGKPLAEEKPESNKCDCNKWSCKVCFPDNTPSEEPKSSKGVKLGDIVTKTEYRMKDTGSDSPLTHAEDNLDENPDEFNDVTDEPEHASMDVEQPLFGEEEQGIDDSTPSTPTNGVYTDQDDAMDMISAIKYMQDMGLSKCDSVYDERELSDMTVDQLKKINSEVMGGTTPSVEEALPDPMGDPKKKTDTKQQDHDSIWNDMENLFGTGTNQPLTVPDNDNAPIDSEEPNTTLPSASRQSTRDKVAAITPDAEMMNMHARINRDAITPDTPLPEPAENELAIRTARDVPSVISNAMQTTGVQSPEWHHLRDLPGFNDNQIRSMGRQVFSMFTNTPAENIQTIANVNGQGPNTDAEMRAVASWLKNSAQDLGKVTVNHGIAVPGYKPDVREFVAKGIRFHVVRDQSGQYIYAYPNKDARIAAPAPTDSGKALGGGNTPRLRESTKGNNMSLSLFEELELDQAIKSALRKLVEDESQEIEESTLSKEIAWKPGSPGKQEKNQGGWNLLQLLHRNHKLSNEAEMEPLPFNRDVLYGYFKNHPDHFIIVKGTHGVAAIRPSEEYFNFERNKPRTRARPNPKGFASDPNKELNSPYLQYQVIAFQNDGKQLDSSLFKDVEATDKGDDGEEDKFSTTDPTVQRLRMGLYHGKDTQSQYNVFKLLSDEIGRLTTMYISGFYALRKGQMGDQKGAEPVIKPHTGSVEREKMKARADLKAPAKPMDITSATTKIFNRIRPVLQPIVAKAYSKVSLALQDAVRDDHQADLERLSAVRKAINEIKIAIDTKGNVPMTGALSSTLNKALARATGFQSYDKQYAPAISELANGPAMKLEPLVQSLRKTLIGAIR
jgi:hypothetical protein